MSIVTYNNRSIRNISATPGAAESLTHIKTLTASSSSTLSFVDGSSDVVLDNTYPIYVFKFINCHPSADNSAFQVNFSVDGGSNYNVTKTTSYFFALHKENGALNNFAYSAGADLAQGTGNQQIAQNIGNDNDQSVSGELTLFNPSSTTFVKHFTARTQLVEYNDNAIDVYTAGYGNTTSAIDAVKFQMDSGNIDAGTIKLYGLKDS
tara:strand:+ start:557 stop:1177 length:621 start_codon:yes stop_codon:yes gene_type:complete